LVRVQENDPWKDPTLAAWAKHVIKDMVPAMEDSAFVISLTPVSGGGDIKYWVELGASIMMDKPLLVVAMPGVALPAKLMAIADEIVYLPEGVTPDGSVELAHAITRITEKLGEQGKEEEDEQPPT
jgi:hypothetical protein